MAKTSADAKRRAAERRASVLVLLAAALWGSNGVFVNLLAEYELANAAITAVRMASVPVVLGLLILAVDRSLLRIDRKDLIWFALNGCVGLFAFVLLYTVAIRLTGMATAAVLLYLMPSMVMLFSAVFLHERFTARKGLCLALSLLGCALVSGLAGGLTLQPAGLAAGLCAAVCYTVHILLIGTKLQAYHPLTAVFYSGLFAAVFSVLYAAARGVLPAAAAVYAAHPAALVLNIAMGVACSVATELLYNTAVKTLPSSKASILATFEPVAAALFGLVLFDQTLDVFGWLGIACELLALVLLRLPEKTAVR